MGLAMKCSNCSAENPDYAFYCGKCATELRGSSAASIQVARNSGVTKEFDKDKWTFRVRAIGAVNILLGTIGMVSYGYNTNMSYLIMGLVTIALGIALLFAPLFEREE
jgi:hypothetical protein